MASSSFVPRLDVGVFGPFSRVWVDRCDETVKDTGEEMPREDFVKEYMHLRSATFKPTIIQSIPTSTSALHVPSGCPTAATAQDDSTYATD
jgi:hypothetical protein